MTIYAPKKLTSSENIKIFMEKYGDDPTKIYDIDYRKDLYNLILSYKNAHNRIFEKYLLNVKIFICDNYAGNIFNEKLYNFIHNYIEINKCDHCGSNTTQFIGFSNGYRRFCSLKCSTNAESTKDAAKKTSLQRYGTNHHLQCRDVIAKREQTNLEKYGATNVLAKNTEIYHKRNDTNLSTYGCISPFGNKSVQEKSRETFIKRYGVSSPMLVDIFKQLVLQSTYEKFNGTGFGSIEINSKIQHTNIIRYGVINAMQNQDIYNKSEFNRHKKKDYKFEDGTIVKIMGYEHFALDLLQLEYKQTDIIVQKELPTIWYYFNGRKRRYFPDIFIKSINKIIEVKSIYTFERYIDKNMKKKESCIEQGFLFEFWIFDRKGILTII